MTRSDDPRDLPVEEGEESRPAPGRQGRPAPEGSRDAGEEEAAIATEAMESEEIGEEIEEELAEIERLRDRLLRLQAEFDNFRKREAKERAAAWARAKADLVQKLLDALDDLGRVARLDPNAGPASSVIDGVRLVERKLGRVLEREGLVAVGEVGEPFDPHVHEAIATLPAPSPEDEGRVAAVAVRGFRFGSQLLRPAQVQVYGSAAAQPAR